MKITVRPIVWILLSNVAAVSNGEATPVDLLPVKSVAAGSHQTCATNSKDELFCWGRDVGSLSGSNVPVFKISDVKKVDVGESSGCLRDFGDLNSLLCWGLIGNTYMADPTIVESLYMGTKDFAVGSSHSCAIVGCNDSLLCWLNNVFITPLVPDVYIPTLVPDLSSGVKDVAVSRDFANGNSHICAISGENLLYCWGHNGSGQLGLGFRSRRVDDPTLVEGLGSGVKSVALGAAHSCAIAGNNDTLYCWGHNYSGQVGIGSDYYMVYVPTSVEVLDSGVKAVALGGSHSCAIAGKGTLYCWGGNQYSQVRIDRSLPFVYVPTLVPGLKRGVKDVVVGGAHSCAITGNGTLYCWGNNNQGQLGVGDYDGRTTPTPVNALVKP